MIQFRLMTKTDLSFLHEMVTLAGWNQIDADWLRFIHMQPDGCFIAEHNGVPAGTATTITYEDKVGWIGMVIVAPAARGKGVGTALLNLCIEYLKPRVRAIKLDATSMGEPLYRKLGFRSEYRVSRMQFTNNKLGQQQPFSPTNPRKIINYDKVAFGASRDKVLRCLIKEYPGQLVCRAEDFCLRGYALANRGRKAWHLGPVVADSDAEFKALLPKILAVIPSQNILIDVPDFPDQRFDILREAGFVEQRYYSRMFLGENAFPGLREKIFATARAEKG